MTTSLHKTIGGLIGFGERVTNYLERLLLCYRISDLSVLLSYFRHPHTFCIISKRNTTMHDVFAPLSVCDDREYRTVGCRLSTAHQASAHSTHSRSAPPTLWDVLSDVRSQTVGKCPCPAKCAAREHTLAGAESAQVSFLCCHSACNHSLACSAVYTFGISGEVRNVSRRAW
jgi:hypothetical protein